MSTVNRFSFLILCTLILHAIAFGGVDPVNTGKDGRAIHGYDPVAYFTEGKPVEGKKAHAFRWRGATWHFVSAENFRLFSDAPEKYAPQFGGYCAYAVGNNYTANGDPHAWTIVDDKLYLNYNKHVQEMWLKEIPELIRNGEKNWPNLLKK